MSAIYLHTKDKTVSVRGSERAYMGWLISGIASSAITISDTPPINKSWTRQLLPDNHYLHRLEGIRYEEGFRTLLTVSTSGHFEVNGEQIDIFEVLLNTCLVIGGEVLKLMVRLHGQSEIHCYIEKEDWKWLLGVVNSGLGSGMFRKNAGWSDLIKLIESDVEGPIVCSYSVCNSFPNAHTAGIEMAEENEDDWYELEEGRQWELAVDGLRKQNGMRISKMSNDEIMFGDGYTMFSMQELIP